MVKRFFVDLKEEFSGYNFQRFIKDLMAGLTVAAVALPLALAFGVSSGADAAAGLITAIVAGFVMSLFSGGLYQISGPTGAMSAVLITLVTRFGIDGVFISTLLAGIILIVSSIFKFGKLIGFIPAPVITGFTSGIAVIIILGQIDNFFGTTSLGETAIQKIISYGYLGFSPNWSALFLGSIVVVIMFIWPKKWGLKVPASLVAIVLAGIISNVFKFDVATIGTIPKTLFLENRLVFDSINLSEIKNFISPAITIAALCMIESLLCGASGSKMTSKKFDPDRELFSQGLGNMVIPFFGGVPATAAIARTSVAIKSGCETRLTGIIHAVGILACMFFLGDIMATLPLSALAGVLIVTGIRMNDWDDIKHIFGKKLHEAIISFMVTMVATIVFDLTIAIVAGIVVAVLLFLRKAAGITVAISKVENKKMVHSDEDVESANKDTAVVYVMGPIFFGTSEKFSKEILEVYEHKKVIFSMRGVSTIDITGAGILKEMVLHMREQEKEIVFCGLSETTKEVFDKTGLTELVGKEQFYFSVDRALLCA